MSVTVWDSWAKGEASDAGGSYREQVAMSTPSFSAAPSLAPLEVAAQG